MSSDPYLYPNSAVLINKLGAKTQKELSEKEFYRTTTRLTKLASEPAGGKHDYQHFKDIHRYIFQDVYTWAGQSRTVDITKGDSLFALPQHIDAQATKLFGQLNAENNLKGLNKEGFAKRAAHYLGEINALHVFREGNGRTQRAFLESVGKAAGHEILWTNVSKEDMRTASIESFSGTGDKMNAVIKKAMDARSSKKLKTQLSPDKYQELKPIIDYATAFAAQKIGNPHSRQRFTDAVIKRALAAQKTGDLPQRLTHQTSKDKANKVER